MKPSCGGGGGMSMLNRVSIRFQVRGKSFGVGGEGKTCDKGATFWKNFEIWAFWMHFPHSEAKMRVFEQNTYIMKFGLFYSLTAHAYSI